MLAIPPVCLDLDDTIQSQLDNKTKPIGALGDIEVLAKQIARIQQTSRPKLDACDLIIFAADHGVACNPVSAYPAEVTRQMVLNFLAGGAAANVMAKVHGVTLKVVDAGIAGPSIDNDSLIRLSIAAGTKDFSHGPAMTEAQLDLALTRGFDLGSACTAPALALGEMGISNTSSAAMISHKILGQPLSMLVGRGTGLDNKQLEQKLTHLELAAQRTEPTLDARQALIEYGGFEIAMIVGAMLGAALQGKVILVDGYIVTAAAVAACTMDPNLRDYLVFSHQSAELGHGMLLNALQAEPLLKLNLRLGEGTGALMAWPLLRTATAILCDMASFESASISGPAA